MRWCARLRGVRNCLRFRSDGKIPRRAVGCASQWGTISFRDRNQRMNIFANTRGRMCNGESRPAFVAVGVESGDVAGYYALSGGGAPLMALSSSVAVAPVGLLADALRRCARKELGVIALLAFTGSGRARRFFERLGFSRLGDGGEWLCFPPRERPRASAGSNSEMAVRPDR
jgi:hypothetical protein